MSGPQLPPESLCQGSLALCSQGQTVESVANLSSLIESTKTKGRCGWDEKVGRGGGERGGIGGCYVAGGGGRSGGWGRSGERGRSRRRGGEAGASLGEGTGMGEGQVISKSQCCLRQ